MTSRETRSTPCRTSRPTPTGRLFREPSEAQAFAMALALHKHGMFTSSEWATALAADIKRAQTLAALLLRDAERKSTVAYRGASSPLAPPRPAKRRPLPGWTSISALIAAVRLLRLPGDAEGGEGPAPDLARPPGESVAPPRSRAVWR
jgi:hypothetical protein